MTTSNSTVRSTNLVVVERMIAQNKYWRVCHTPAADPSHLISQGVLHRAQADLLTYNNTQMNNPQYSQPAH